MKKKFVSIIITFVISITTLISIGQNDGLRPQLWNNLFVGWNVNDKFVWRNSAAFNILLSTESPWNEISLSTSAVYKFHRFFELDGGFYFARARQSKDLKSFEYRPFIGLRMATNNDKRWYVTNLTRLEARFFTYSDRESETGYRFRNRTYAIVSLLKKKMNSNKNLYLFGYFEAFYNFETEVRERFFNQFKYKLGLGYRFSYPWRIDFGVIYQDAKNTTGELTPYDSNIITRFIVEWGVAYIIGPKKKSKNEK